MRRRSSWRLTTFPTTTPVTLRNDKQKGQGWCEWELVKAARPRFEGHSSPRCLCGDTVTNRIPRLWSRRLLLRPIMASMRSSTTGTSTMTARSCERGLEQGFMRAGNAERLKFGLMWADHDWIAIFPARHDVPSPLVYPGKMSAQGFARMNDYVIGKYFKHPSYWLIDGKPYFSIYDLGKLLESFGSVEATRAALDRFREKTRQAGLPGLHLNAVVWGQPVLPGEQTPADPVKLIADLGFDSTTSYVWVHHVAVDWPRMDYLKSRDGYFPHWERMLRDFPQPYFPNVSMGWDPTPRTLQSEPWERGTYPFTGVITGNTPARFRESLQLVKDRLLAAPTQPKIITINCWNEWTEGSYLEPDTKSKFAYLEAVRAVFGAAQQ